jgi:selenocysteine-specific elongation factor
MNLMVGTAGHIDHGKTALVKFFTGCETDTLKEEKDRGMSINLGFAPCPLGRGKRIGLVDVPGHEDFIRNMVAGATGIDLLMLVVAADDGIMPQTVEHFNITQLLGVKNGIAVITKTDLVPEERVAEVKADVAAFLEGTYLEGCPILPFSAVTAQGLSDIRKVLDELVDKTERRRTEGVFRLPVERSFSAEGFGTIMTGIAARGKLQIRDEVEILPIGQKGVVRKLQVFAQDWDEAFAGQCLAINVGGVDSKVVKRGAVLATAGYFKPTDMFHARLRVLRDASGPLKNRTPIRFHTGTTETFGHVVLLDHTVLNPGENGLVQFLLENPIIIEAGDSYIIRLQNPVTTVGGGKVVGHSDRRFKRNRDWVNAAIGEEEASLKSDNSRALHVIRNAAANGIDRKELGVRATLIPAQVAGILEEFAASGDALLLPGDRIVVSGPHFEAFRTDLLSRVAEMHKADPLRVGYTAVELRREMDARSELLTAVLEILVEKGEVVLDRELYRLASFKVQLDDELSRIADQLGTIYRDGGFKTPRIDQINELVAGKAQDIAKVFQQLVESGVLVRVDPKIAFHSDNVEMARQRIVAHIEEHGELDSFAFKELIESSRKYAIPLLDHFDAIGVTVRGHQHKRYLKK